MSDAKMALSLGVGVVRDHDVWYRDAEADATWIVLDSMDHLLFYLRARFGEFILDFTEGFMTERARYSVYQRPF